LNVIKEQNDGAIQMQYIFASCDQCQNVPCYLGVIVLSKFSFVLIPLLSGVTLLKKLVTFFMCHPDVGLFVDICRTAKRDSKNAKMIKLFVSFLLTK